MSVPEWLELVWPAMLAAGTLLAAAGAALHVVLYKRSVHATIAWVGLIALLPLLGPIFYLLFGINRIRRKALALRQAQSRPTRPEGAELAAERQSRDMECAPSSLGDDALEGLARLGRRITGAPLLGGNDVRMLRDGDEAYPAMLEAIARAERSVTLSTYIFDNDEAGRRFVGALIEAHERGVAVRVLVDSVGMHYSWPSVGRALRAAGVPTQTFLPILRPGQFTFMNLRTHRKIMVVDGDVGFTGGINIRQAHVLVDDPPGATHDTHFWICGPLVHQLQETMADDWYFAAGELLEGPDFFPEIESCGQVIGRGINDGPDEDFQNLQWILLGALSAAHERVVIVTPYFLPEDIFQQALQVAAMRGVRVDIVLPERSNLPYIDWASRPSWEPLLKHGCSIWLCPPPFDHSKLMVVDGRWSLFGSANWDPRSLKLNFEFNVEAYDASLAAQILELADARIARAEQVTLEDYERRGLLERIRDGVFRLGTPYL